MPSILAIFSRRLRHARDAAGLTQDELADRAGVARNTLSRIERGEDTSLSTAGRLARALHVPLEQMLVDEPTPDAAAVSPGAIRERRLAELLPGLGRRSLDQLVTHARMLHELEGWTAKHPPRGRKTARRRT
jgi:transcriptional regulator with XRE-family HTH domain